jgi:thioredoxin reductase (NADPH)
MQHQARKYGMEAAYAEVTSVERADGRFLLKTTEDYYLAKAVILTGGASYRSLGVPGEERLTGKGVSYCATCDGALFRDQTVAVVGGGDAAIDEALFLTRYVSRVNLIHRRDQLRAGLILQERAFSQPKISFLWNTVVTEILGEEAVTGLRLRNLVTGDETEMAVAAVFIFVGTEPSRGYLSDLVKRDDTGHIAVNAWMETDVAGLFAAGDVRANASRQVVSAAGDGATAAIRADEYISAKFGAWAPQP